MAKAKNKTQATAVSAEEFIETVEHPVRREDAKTLLALFRRVTGKEPVMWGPSIIGFGEYHYKYETGREGDFLATGFSPRKANSTIYIMPGYQDFSSYLDRLGKHKLGKSCLYINKLNDVDLDVLEELVAAGLTRLKEIYPDADC